MLYQTLGGYVFSNVVMEAFQIFNVTRHWWLTLVILATQEAEIRKMAV
jgi:hypothetical protein